PPGRASRSFLSMVSLPHQRPESDREPRQAKRRPTRVTEPPVLFLTSNRIPACVIPSLRIRESALQLPAPRSTVACGRPPAPFFRSAPGVERVIILDKKKLAGDWLDLWKQVVGTRWEMVVDIRGSALSYLIPAKRRVVYNRSWETGLRKVEMVSRLMG